MREREVQRGAEIREGNMGGRREREEGEGKGGTERKREGRRET